MIYLEQPALKTVESKAQQMGDCISLAQGALRIGGISALIKEKVIEMLHTDSSDYYSYSLGMPALREKIATHLNQFHDAHLTGENIMITHGAINALSALCLMILETNDEVLIPEPTYPPYLSVVALAKARATMVPAYRFIDNQWIFDFERITAAATDRTKMVMLAHPSNPTGTCLSREEMHRLAVWCESRKIYCLIDEAYDSYFFNVQALSSSGLIEHFEHIIRIGSFSKTFGMSGWRVGFAVAPKKIIARMAGIQDGLILCPSVLAQYAALFSYDFPEVAAFYSKTVHENRDLTINLLSSLKKNGFFSFAIPPAGFFLFIKTPASDSRVLAEQILAHARVALVPGYDFGPSGKSFLRLCYARDKKIVAEAIGRLECINDKKDLFY